jgi:hypothetical protein
MTQTVRDVQKPVIEALLKFAQEVGAHVYLADTVLSPRPTFWFCGTVEQRKKLLSDLNSRDIRVFALQGRKRTYFDPNSQVAQHAVAYQKHVFDGVVLHGAASGIEIAFCSYNSETDVWRTRRAGVESEAQTAYLSTLEETEFLGFRLPTLGNAVALQKQCEPFRKVDLVYTWVDGDDPAWIARKKQAEEKVDLSCGTADSLHSTRFDSQNELLCAIRSAFRYFVDIGNVYVVTDQQTPSFLGDLLDRITVVDHRDIFPSHDFLPCFNSHAIEANLHRIQGLSEYYLYLNDDFLFGSAMSASDFFDEYGRSYQFYSEAACLPNLPFSDGELAVNAAGINNRSLLYENFGVFAFRKFKHVAYATVKSVMVEMEEEIPEAWIATMANRFRSSVDFSIAGALYQQYAALNGKAIGGSIRYGYFDTASHESTERAQVLLNDDWERPQMFCINDTVPAHSTNSTKKKLMNILEYVIPERDGYIQKLISRQDRYRRRWGFFGPRTKEV